MVRKIRLVCLCLSVLILASSFASADDNRGENINGKWQLSWEARLGTERCTMQIEQVSSTVTGTYQGRLGSPKLSGRVEGKNVILNLAFRGAHPYVLVFTGSVDGNTMGGNFDVEGVVGGYDSHGENAHPTNYLWTAVRQPDPTRSDISGQNKRSNPGESHP